MTYSNNVYKYITSSLVANKVGRALLDRLLRASAGTYFNVYHWVQVSLCRVELDIPRAHCGDAPGWYSLGY